MLRIWKTRIRWPLTKMQSSLWVLLGAQSKTNPIKDCWLSAAIGPTIHCRWGVREWKLLKLMFAKSVIWEVGYVRIRWVDFVLFGWIVFLFANMSEFGFFVCVCMLIFLFVWGCALLYVLLLIKIDVKKELISYFANCICHLWRGVIHCLLWILFVSGRFLFTWKYVKYLVN